MHALNQSTTYSIATLILAFALCSPHLVFADDSGADATTPKPREEQLLDFEKMEQEAEARGIPRDWLAAPPAQVPTALYPRPALGDPVFQAEIDSLCVNQQPKNVELKLADVLASATRIKKGRQLPEKHVILSFDDGPHYPYTSLILDMLARCKVKAHFFVVGQLAAREEHGKALQRFLEMGHVVGSHSHTHANLLKVSLVRARAEIERGHQSLEKALGIKTPFFRFPFGAGSASHALREILRENGLVSMGWSMSAYDTVYDKPASVLVHSLTRFNEEAKGGMIFLAHDRKRATVRMLPDLLTFLVEQGYTFVTVLPTENPFLKQKGDDLARGN